MANIKIHFFDILTATLVLVAIFGFASCKDCESKESSYSPERRLREFLLCDYDTKARPRKNSQESVNVTMRMVVKNFRFVDPSRSGSTTAAKLTIGVWVVLNWNDEYMKWTKEDYEHEETVIDSYEIWTPDLSLYNSISGTNSGENIGFSIPCLIKNTGSVTCIPHMVYETTCRPNYQRWPLDTQNCSMTFGTWMHRGEEVRFKINKNRAISVGAANTNSYWTIINSGTKSSSGEYECCPNQTYPTVTFWIQLERKSADGILFLVTPALVMILLTVTSLLLDISSTERIVLMIVNLCYHLTFIKNLTDIAPFSGDIVPNAVIYFRDSTYLCCMVMIEGLLLRSILKRTDVVPRWISSVNGMMNTGAGKIIMFHEFDPAATAIVSGDPDTLDKEEMETVSKRDWLRFTLFINRIFLIVVFFVYVGLFVALMRF